MFDRRRSGAGRAASGLACVLALGACGPSVVSPGASYLRGAMTGRRTWAFNCDPAVHNPPGAAPLDLDVQPVTFQCRAEDGGATLALVLRWASGGSNGPRGSFTLATQDLTVVLVEATTGTTTTATATASRSAFHSGSFSGRTVGGTFSVSGDVTGEGEFELVAR